MSWAIDHLPEQDVVRVIADGVADRVQLRIAILVDPDSPSRADFEFYAIQCGNLVIHFLRLFFDASAALEWLARERPSVSRV